MSKEKKTKDVKVELASYDSKMSPSEARDYVNDVHAYKVNPNLPTAEDLDCSKLTPETFDRRFQ